jgi:hypothetical protein
MAKDPFDEMKSPLVDKPEYLQAIGLVTVEINIMEFMLAAVLGVTIKVSPDIARAIYYAPRAASARVDILADAAVAAITDNPRLLASITSLTKRAKGIFNDRHAVAHDRWVVPAGATTVHRGSGASLDHRAADLAELGDLVKRARSLTGRCLILLARLTVGRTDLGVWPTTMEDARRTWAKPDQPRPSE